MIINDYVELSVLVNADGIHLGQSDANLMLTREKIGKHKLIGLSVNNFQDIINANNLPIDYIGVGPIFILLINLR